jgi:PAS domain S-box-containing protein
MEAQIMRAENARETAEPPLGLLEFHTGHFCQSLLQGLPGAKFQELASRSFAASPAAVMVTDRHGVIECVNEKFCALTGYSGDEICGLTPRILRSAESPREGFRELWQTLLGGHDWHGEFRNRRKNGESYWEFASIWPIANHHGEVEHFLAVKSDITQRKVKVEAEQRVIVASERALAALDLLKKSLFVCAWCQKVRDDHGRWVRFDTGLFQRANLAINHGICPECKADQLRAITGPGQAGAFIAGIDFRDGAYAPKHWGINE